MNGLLQTFLQPKANWVLWLALTSFILACAPQPASAQFTQQGPKLAPSSIPSAAVGQSVAISADGNTAILGAPMLEGSFVFVRTGTTWTQQGPMLSGTGDIGASQGSSVAISADGNTAIVGGSSDNNMIGAGWVFVRSGGTWTQQGEKLVGSGITGSTAWQGYSVALSGDGNTAMIGGPQDDGGIGAAWVFTRSGTTWTQEGTKLVGTWGAARIIGTPG
jgi:hypothetical protein